MKQDNSAVPKMQGPRCQECREVGNLRQLGSRRKSNALMGLHRPNVPSQMGEGMFNGITDTWVGPVTVHVYSLAPPMCPLKPLLKCLICYRRRAGLRPIYRLLILSLADSCCRCGQLRRSFALPE